MLASNTLREKNYNNFPALITLFEINKKHIKIHIDKSFDILIRSYPLLPPDYKCVLFRRKMLMQAN